RGRPVALAGGIRAVTNSRVPIVYRGRDSRHIRYGARPGAAGPRATTRTSVDERHAGQGRAVPPSRDWPRCPWRFASVQVARGRGTEHSPGEARSLALPGTRAERAGRNEPHGGGGRTDGIACATCARQHPV